MKDRLRELLLEKGINARQFADQIGVQASAVSHVLNGRNKPGVDFLEKLLHAYPETDIHWLITGERRRTPSSELGDKQSEPVNKPIEQEQDEVILLRPDGTYSRFKSV